MIISKILPLPQSVFSPVNDVLHISKPNYPQGQAYVGGIELDTWGRKN